MKYKTIKKNRFNTRAHGSYADYPIYRLDTGEEVGILECYACDVDLFINKSNEVGNIDSKPFYKNEELEELGA